MLFRSSTDVCVPVSRLPDLVYDTKRDIEESGLVSTIVGHVGDGEKRLTSRRPGTDGWIGNFHALLLFTNDDELDVARGLVHRMVERAIALDGTCAFILLLLGTPVVSNCQISMSDNFLFPACRHRRARRWNREARVPLR